MKTAPRIAVVDDESIVAMDMKSTLCKLGYEVSGTAPSGQEAVTMTTKLKPDLVLMDIRLNGELDGIEAARQIQSQCDVPVVYVTAYADEATLARARETYPYGYLVKPVQEAALSSTITTALCRYRAEQQAKLAFNRQRALLDTMGHLLWTAREDGRAEYFNRRWLDYTGLTEGASRGFGWITALHPADMRRCLSLWKEAVTKKKGLELVCSVMGNSGKHCRRHLLQIAPLADAPGGFQWLATLTDVHDLELRSETTRFAGTATHVAPTTIARAVTSDSDQQSGPAEPEPERSSQPTEEAADAAKPQAPKNFRDWFCAVTRCTPAQFADRVFLITLYVHALPLAVVFWPWRNRLFAADFALIEQAAWTRLDEDTQCRINGLRTPEWLGGLDRRLLRCRISTRSLVALMGRTMKRSGRP